MHAPRRGWAGRLCHASRAQSHCHAMGSRADRHPCRGTTVAGMAMGVRPSARPTLWRRVFVCTYGNILTNDLTLLSLEKGLIGVASRPCVYTPCAERRAGDDQTAAHSVRLQLRICDGLGSRWQEIRRLRRRRIQEKRLRGQWLGTALSICRGGCAAVCG